uniref:Uncharacterized protein n=1 Tax=Siphoviridae sp. ctYh54 TaxID=2826379 RepID=A0A8S5ME02_9CAUD|nr:MAG TPA: hypothetical protein [Siphoviridae sp. ctYh54]
MSFASMKHYYSGSWITENYSQGYSLANLVVAALEQGKLKEYKLTNSSGKLYAENGLILDRNGVTLPIPSVRAMYIIGNDLSISSAKGKDIKAEVEKVLGQK